VALVDASLRLHAARADGSLISESIARIGQLDSTINAVPILFEQEEVVMGTPGRRFSGVPLLVKDALCAVKGERRTEGSLWLKRADYRDDYSSHVVERLLAAGFGLIGRTSSPEFASSDTTETVAWGVTRNPWNLEHSTGGSSGGAAAAVSARYVSVAHGTDASGSVRIPAAWCGVFGFKPSRGLVPNTPDFAEIWGTLGARSTHGILSRTVRDMAAVLDVIAGPLPGAFTPLSPPKGGYLAGLRGRGRLRILVVEPDEDWEPGVYEALMHVAAVLADLGHDVHVGRVPQISDIPKSPAVEVVPGSAMLALITWWSERLGCWPREQDLEPATWSMTEVGRTRTAQELMETLAWFDATSRHVATWCSHADLLLTPTSTRSAPKLGKSRDGWSAEDVLVDLERTTRFTNPFSITGQPAISLPGGTSIDGLPIGVQIVGTHGGDADVLRISHSLEVSGFVAGSPQIPITTTEGES